MEYRFCPSYKLIEDNTKLISQTPIPELNAYPSQKLKLVRNSDACPKNYPRSVFFSVPPSIFDEFKNQTNTEELIQEINAINKDVKYDQFRKLRNIEFIASASLSNNKIIINFI